MNKDYILVLGPPGSGKSTQGKLLAEFLGYQFLSTGALLRSLKEKNDPLSAEVEKYWLRGVLVPDMLINQILFNTIKQTDSPGFILDGFPRSLEQLNHLMEFLSEQESALTHVFYVSVSDEECMKRLELRKEIENRADENDDAIKNRLETYHSQTEPLLEEYERMGRLTRVDGERSIEAIQDDIRSSFTQVQQ